MTVKPEYVEDRWVCPGCGHLNPRGEKTCSMCPHDGRRPLEDTPERPLRRHLDDRSTEAGDPDDACWPVPGCISPPSE